MIDRWYDQSSEPVLAPAMTLSAGVPVAVKMEYYEHTGNAKMGLAVIGPWPLSGSRRVIWRQAK